MNCVINIDNASSIEHNLEPVEFGRRIGISKALRNTNAKKKYAVTRLERLEAYLRARGVELPTDDELDAVFRPAK